MEENRFKLQWKRNRQKKKDKKGGGGGIWCVLLKITLPYVADNKKKFRNKSAISLQSVCYYQRNKEQGVLGNRWHCVSDALKALRSNVVINSVYKLNKGLCKK